MRSCAESCLRDRARRHRERRPRRQRSHTEMWGKLSWQAIPFHEPIALISGGFVFAVVGAILIWVALKGYVPYLWREWITSVDHKRIGIMYVALALVMLLRGFSDALMMRAQQAVAFHGAGYLPPGHYDQIFTAH